MADIGNTTPPGANDEPFGIENNAAGIVITMPEDGSLTSISAWVYGSSGVGDAHTARAAIYATDGTLLGTSDEAGPFTLTSPDSAIEFPFSAPVALNNGVSYIIMVGGSPGGGSLIVAGTNLIGGGKKFSFTYTSGFPNPATIRDESTDYWLYATYTSNGGGANIPAAHRHYMRQKRAS